MNTLTWSKGILWCSTLLVFAGCQTSPNPVALNVTPTVPAENEEIVRDQVIVIVDATGSIGVAREFDYQKSNVVAFAAGMPEGAYESGLDSFAGVPANEWVDNPLSPFRRTVMESGASDLEPLGSLTPLARAIRNQTAEFAGKGGRGALLIFSDGKVRNPEEVLEACQDLQRAHGGELCIFTVQVGSSDRGRRLLEEMATINGCGQYYDGASLQSESAIDALERDIFLGMRAIPVQAAVPEPDVALAINNVLFDNDESVVASMYDAELQTVADTLKNHPGMHIRLAGHTDSNASNAYNQKLSERRVDAVKAALVTRGAASSRVLTDAYGEERPVEPNNSPEQMHQNRRVELTIVESNASGRIALDRD